MALIQFADHMPRLGDQAWVADSAQVLGRVQLGAQASVWYGSVLRADNDNIHIGARSNIQDNAMLHVDAGVPLQVGEDVSIGHQVMLHGCTIGDGTLIGIQSLVLNGARIGKHCLVGAGSLVTEGKQFPDGVLIFGRPAKVMRPLEPQEIERLMHTAAHYVTQAQAHRTQARRIA